MKIRTMIGIMAALLLGSCAEDPLIEDGVSQDGVPEGMVRVALFVDAGDYSKPVTRTGKADENTIDDDVWVFVFKDTGTDNNNIFMEAAKATATGSKWTVTLTAVAEKRMLLVLANTPAQFYEDDTNPSVDFATGIAAWLTGKTYSEAEKMMTTALAASPLATVPYTPSLAIPMSNKLSLANGIDAGTVINSSGTSGSGALPLYRIVAKVTVTNAAQNFTLAGATVIGAARQSFLFPKFTDTDGFNPVTSADSDVDPLTTNYLTTTSGQEVTGIAAATGAAGAESTNARPIYIYEAAAGTTSVIIEGTYMNVKGYYRLAFKKPAEDSALPIKRNHWYKLTITSVSGAGYPTVGEAMEAQLSNVIAADIKVIDLSSHDIIDNGLYYLGVSNSEFRVYADGALSGLVAVTVTTNATETDVTTNSVSVSGTGLTLPELSKTLTLSAGGTDIGETQLKIGMSSAFTEGAITIKLGSLTKTISVSRTDSLNCDEMVMEFSSSKGFSDDFSAGQIEKLDSDEDDDDDDDWLSLSLDNITFVGSEVTHTNEAGKLYLMVTDNDMTINNDLVAREGRNVYLSRQSNKGRMKLYLTQKASKSELTSNCFMIAQGKRILIPVSRANESPEVGPQLGSDETFTAELVWTDTLAIKKITEIGTGPGGYISIVSGSKLGNAVVAIKNLSGEILWSWHIWVTDHNPGSNTWKNSFIQELVPYSYTFMDRNLGATDAAVNNTPASYGLFYQWGRKDPFPGKAGAAGYAAISEFSGIEGSKSGTPIPNTEGLTASIRNPTSFYRVEGTNNWLPNDYDGRSNFWAKTDNTKGIYDPCPKGWRVPVSKYLAWYKSSGSGTTYEHLGNGLYRYPGDEDDGFFIASPGCINDAGFYLTTLNSARCWEASVRVTMIPISLQISNRASGNDGNPVYGYNVRCVAE